ncbi:hypothetical protein VTH06DRAFT_6272 [Thermothelomyces fergusii]
MSAKRRQIVFAVILREMLLYENITGRMVVYWLSRIGSGAGPLILSWINEICSDDTEKRAILVAAANDFAYVVQAVAPNFVWKTTDFPKATKGYTWSIILQCLLILATAIVQYLLWRDEKRAIKQGTAIPPSASSESTATVLEGQPRESEVERRGKNADYK